MRASWFVLVATVFLVCGCDGAGTDGPGGGVFYGSCDSRPPAGDPCVDYYCDSASDCSDPATNGQATCTSGGTYGEPGTWSTSPCPTGGLFGTCSVTTTGDGRLDNRYYTDSGSVGEAACELAGGTWTPGS
jgi:hypothetical protein